MSEDVKPALTPEEWQNWERGDLAQGYFLSAGDDGGIWLGGPASGTRVVPEEKHALAALCLYQQPFGFTPRHAESLRVLGVLIDTLEVPTGAPLRADLEEIRARIVALLPPTP